MLCRSLFMIMISSLLLFSVESHADIGVYNKGLLKLRGNIVEGACVVSIGSRTSSELIVDMGSYRNDQFSHPGGYSDKEFVSFRIDISLCNIDASRNIDMIFSGDTASEDKQLFKVRLEKSFFNESISSESNETTGLGLALFDKDQNMLYPNVITRNTKFRGKEGTLVFLAKYKMVRDQIVAGRYFSEVNFKILYP